MGLSANQKEVFLFVALLFLISSGLFGIQRVQLAQLEGKYTANIVALEGDIKTLQQQLDADVQAANRNILDQRKILEQQISQLTKTDENVLQQLGTVHLPPDGGKVVRFNAVPGGEVGQVTHDAST